MGTTDRSRVIHLAEAQAGIPGPAGEHAVSVLQRGTLKALLSLGRFAPLPRPTTPHAQDEVYVIIRGRGVFLHDGKRASFYRHLTQRRVPFALLHARHPLRPRLRAIYRITNVSKRDRDVGR